MPRNHFARKCKISPIIVIILLAVFQMTFCESDLFWCGDKQEVALEAVNGRNFSVRFALNDPLTEVQSLVWAKWITLDNRLLDNIDNTSANRERYKLTIESGKNAIDLFIAFTELSDSGKHVVKINYGKQSLCAIAIFNLTIEGTAPICSTLFDQDIRRVQMSCAWVQVNLGDQVQLLAGNQVVYEYETTEMNIDGDFNSTNKFSVYLPLENVHDKRVVPSMCFISNSNRSVNKSCTFLPIRSQTLRSEFECCTTEEADAIKFWYNNESNLIPLIFTDKLSLIHVGPFSFFCGIQSGNKTVLLHSILNVNLVEGKQYNISLSALGRTEGSNNSNDNLMCDNIFFEVRNTDEDIQYPKENLDLNTMPDNTERIEITVTPEASNTNKVSTWVWAILVLSLIFCLVIGSVNCYYMVLRKYRYHFEKEINDAMQIESMVAIGDTITQSEDRGNLHLQELQSCRDSKLRGATVLQGSIGQERHKQNQVRKAPMSNLQSRSPSLHSHHQHSDPESSWFAHRPTNYTPNREDHKGAIGRTTTGFDTNPDKHIRQDLASALYPDTAYCSVDDVKGTSKDISKEHRPSHAPSFPYPNPSPKDHFDMGASMTSPSLFKSGVSQQNASMMSMARVPEVDTDVDALYAKPDMSRKTNKMTSLESDYDDPRPPGNYLGRNSGQDTFVLEHGSEPLVLNHTDFFGNMIANPTDELTDGGELYINAPAHSFS